MGKLDEKFYASLEYVMKKCMEYNPEDRLTH